LILIKRPAAPAIPEMPVKVAPVKVPPIKVIPAKVTPQPNFQKNPNSNDSDSIAVSCKACGKELRAPRRAAGKAIRCPGCQATIPVLNEISFEPTQVKPSQSYSQQRANSYPASPLQDDSLWASIPPASAIVPYSGSSGFDNSYEASSSYGVGGARRGLSRGSRVIQYNIIGVLMMVWSGLIVLGCIIRPITIAVTLANLPPNTTIDYDKLTPLLIGTGIGIAVGLAIAYVMFQGGYNIYYQTELESAKQIAIFCAIPCCGSCCFPVGIWACFLLFGKNAKRDFGG